jgi:hypothetical protein
MVTLDSQPASSATHQRRDETPLSDSQSGSCESSEF